MLPHIFGVAGTGAERHDRSTHAACCFDDVRKSFSLRGANFSIRVSHVLRSGEGRQGDSRCARLMLDVLSEALRQLFRQAGKACRSQVELHAAVSVRCRGSEHRGCVGKGIGTGKDRWIHQTAPVTAASTILEPEGTDCAMAAMARTEATPSPMSAPTIGFESRIVSAKPSSWRR